MKSVVTKNLRCWLILLAKFFQPLYAMAENSCDCSHPPGGRITCEDKQVAICRVKDGKVYGECKTPPQSARKANDLRAWILSKLVQKTIRPEDVERWPKYQRILAEGRYKDPKTGEIVRFVLPRSW